MELTHTNLSEHSHNLTSVGPCIVIYFYSKTNQIHNISNLFYFGTTLYVLYFRTVHAAIFILFKTNSCTPF
jgi:hypothetical protein